MVTLRDNLWSTTPHGSPMVRRKFPIGNLLLYLPLGHPELSGSPIVSKDLNAYSCTVTGATHVPPFYRSFDGDDDIEHPTFLDVMPSSGIVAFGAWVYFDAQDVEEYIMAKVNVIGQDRIHLLKTGGNTLRLFTEGGNNGNRSASSVATMDAATWYLCIGVYTSGAVIQVYLGAQTASTMTRATGQVSETIGNGTALNFAIGSRSDVSFMTGRIGEVWVWDADITQARADHILRMTRWRYA